MLYKLQARANDFVDYISAADWYEAVHFVRIQSNLFQFDVGTFNQHFTLTPMPDAEELLEQLRTTDLEQYFRLAPDVLANRLQQKQRMRQPMGEMDVEVHRFIRWLDSKPAAYFDAAARRVEEEELHPLHQIVGQDAIAEGVISRAAMTRYKIREDMYRILAERMPYNRPPAERRGPRL